MKSRIHSQKGGALLLLIIALLLFLPLLDLADSHFPCLGETASARCEQEQGQ